MKELDNEYKRLIMIRYVLNNFKVRNKEDLEREVEGISNLDGLLAKIADDIANELKEWKTKKKGKTKEEGKTEKEVKTSVTEEVKTSAIEEEKKEDKKEKRPCVGRVTLGRMMGKYPGKGISMANLDRIAKYIGRANWDDLTAVGAEHAEWEMLCNNDISKTAIISSIDYKDTRVGPGLHHLLSHNINKGMIVDIRYGDGLLLKLKKHNDDDEFIIQHCDSKVLKKGWAIRIPLFYVGVNVTGFQISSHGLRMKDCYKSRDVIKSIEVGYI